MSWRYPKAEPSHELRVILFREDGGPMTPEWQQLVVPVSITHFQERPYTHAERVRLAYSVGWTVADIWGCKFRVEQRLDPRWEEV